MQVIIWGPEIQITGQRGEISSFIVWLIIIGKAWKNLIQQNQQKHAQSVASDSKGPSEWETEIEKTLERW